MAADRADLRLRVVLAIAALLLSNVGTTLIPFVYKGIIDSLDSSAPNSAMVFGLAIPIVLVTAYVLGDIVDADFQQLRDMLFVSMGQNAVRKIALRTFHLARCTGGLSRVIERGIKGIETIVRFTMLNILPTVVEFAITAVIFISMFGVSYLGVLIVMIWGYLYFTIKASN
ncbi:MAG: hypothetical protein MO846_01860 [Candidatus Devosia symbiotica]|nr:hypothetical protein [Candidatus Devosia symbiotica]